jgi:hypothetical protein
MARFEELVEREELLFGETDDEGLEILGRILV